MENSCLIADLQQRIEERTRMGLRRQRLVRDGPQQPAQILDSRPLVSFCSNDYLGLANDPEVIAGFVAEAKKNGVGSGASHLVTGHSRVHHALEEELADFLGRDSALVFSTGYMANTGIINALMPIGGLVLQDALNHASLLDGGWLSRAQSRRYPHADMPALQQELAAVSENPVLVVSDGVFSMDGDLAPLPEMIALCQQHQAWLMIDDAHGFGCIGAGGRGIVGTRNGNEIYDQQEIPVLVGTLGKALGAAGAFVAGDRVLIDYLVQFARPYVFSTAMPSAVAEAARVSLRLVQSQGWRRERLQGMIRQFREKVIHLGLPLLESETPVQAIVLGDAERSLKASQWFREKGLHLAAIRPPTVPAGSARLRITLSAAHTDEQLQQLLTALEEFSQHWHGGRWE